MRKTLVLLSMFLIPYLNNLYTFAETDTSNQNVLRYEIVNKEFDSDDDDEYKLITVRAVIQGDNLTEDGIREMLKQIITEIRKQDNPDAINLYAYKTKEDAEKAAWAFSMFNFLAKGEWWPKGHSLHPRNAANIQDKESYEINFNIPEQRDIPEEIIVARFSKETRRKIYYELDEAEYRAQEEAEKIYPFMFSKDLSWKKVGSPEAKKNFEKMNELFEEYRKQIMQKYKLTEEEVEMIEQEARLDRWPETNPIHSYGSDEIKEQFR